MSISARQRFLILRRDGFTCQYCGQKPPSVKLEVDHIEPKSKGGGDEDENLITACFECNRGKHVLSVVPQTPRPGYQDARFLCDLLITPDNEEGALIDSVKWRMICESPWLQATILMVFAINLWSLDLHSDCPMLPQAHTKEDVEANFKTVFEFAQQMWFDNTEYLRSILGMMLPL